MAHSSLLFPGRRTDHVSYIVLRTSLHILSNGFMSNARCGQSTCWTRPVPKYIIESQENHKWRSGLAVNSLYPRDKASVQRAPLRSRKRADNAGRPVERLLGREILPLHGRFILKLFKHTTSACGGRPILRVVTPSLGSVNKSLPIVCFHCQFYGSICGTGPALISGLMTIATQRPVFGFWQFRTLLFQPRPPADILFHSRF